MVIPSINLILISRHYRCFTMWEPCGLTRAQYTNHIPSHASKVSLKGWPHYRPVRPDAFNGVFGAADVLLVSIPAVCEAALAGSCPEENSTGFGCMLSRPTSAFCLIFKPNIRPFCTLSSCKGLRCISYKNEKQKEKQSSLSCTKLKPPVSLEHNLLEYFDLSESGSEHLCQHWPRTWSPRPNPEPLSRLSSRSPSSLVLMPGSYINSRSNLEPANFNFAVDQSKCWKLS